MSPEEPTDYADDDPEYAGDPALHDDAEAWPFAAADPTAIPPDQGDAGVARVTA
jgi:hypothetical protein